ncbi:family 4C encapsulin nanocompartment shell protein [Rubrivirga sp. IMCC45206]|uniref:family 4C encapsulin nanocompartment shell protein n=1 Tax=Rubrivirga sp. IMCC45206 TaxID=3391614 RepID=UPI00398FFCD7
MTVTDAAPAPDDLLSEIDEQVRSLRESGGEPHAILVGPDAYEALKSAVAERFGRERADLSQYQWLTVVVDPFRGARVAVVPTPREVSAGVRAERRDEG